MTYYGAKKCFQENVDLCDPNADPIMWNLNNGLLQLASALSHDLEEIKTELKRVKRALNA